MPPLRRTELKQTGAQYARQFFRAEMPPLRRTELKPSTCSRLVAIRLEAEMPPLRRTELKHGVCKHGYAVLKAEMPPLRRTELKRAPCGDSAACIWLKCLRSGGLN